MRTTCCFRTLLCLLFLFVASAALAQTTGTLRGTVKDPSDAVVAAATAKVTEQNTGATRTVTSESDGSYVFAVLPVGEYTLQIEAKGFKRWQRKEIRIDIGRVAVVDAKLEVGAATEVVEVGAEAPLVETTSTQLGAVVNDRAVAGLPLSSRDTYQLLQLQPGVQSNVGGDLFYGNDVAGAVTVNGGRSRANNYTVNGGDANDSFVNAPVVQPAPDTIEEFRVLTNTFDAEFGRNSGAVVNVVTKSGTNDFHGSVYEFHRNDVFNARGFFDVERPKFIQNQFGFTFGGPIKKDKTFFFASYEGRRRRQGISSDVVTVPTLAERGGDFSDGGSADPFPGSITDDTVATLLNNRCGLGIPLPSTTVTGDVPYATIFPGNLIPMACFDPTALDLMNQFVPEGNIEDGVFQSVPALQDDGTQFTGRFDHRFNDQHQLSIYYFYSDTFQAKPFARFQAGGAVLPGFGDLSDQRFQQWNISHTWVVSPTTVNEFRFNYFRQGQETFFHPQRTHLVTASCVTVSAAECFSDPSNPALGITPGLGADREGVPFIDVSGGFSIGNNFEGELPATGNVFQWSDNFSKVMGKHSLKFGGDVRRVRYDQFLFFDINGEHFLFGGGPNDVGHTNLFPNYLLGLSDFYLQGAANEERVRTTGLYLYVQDSWKLRDNLTLNYGLRWELNTPLTDVGQRIQTFRPGQATTIYPCELSSTSQASLGFPDTNCNPGGSAEAVFPLGLVIPGDAGVPGGLTQTYYGGFAPRIGLAWSPGATDGWLATLTGGPGKTSIRMGWGLFYNPVEQLVLEQFSAEPPFGGSSGLSNVLFNTPFLGQNGVVSPNPFGGILDPPRGEPVDWSRFRPILLFGQAQPDMRAQYSAQYNLTIQRELRPDLMLQIGYVGSQGHRLLATYDLNPSNSQTCLDLQAIADDTGNPDLECGPFFSEVPYVIPAGTVIPAQGLTLPYGSVSFIPGGTVLANDITLVGLRPFSSPLCEPTTGVGCPPDGVPVFSSIFAQDTVAHSNYHSLQVLVEKRFSHGLQFTGAYTWSKSIDNASSFEQILPPDPADWRRNRSLSLFHAAHRFVFSYYWELPVPKYQGAKGKLLNGWAISGITTFQTGFPIRILSEDDNELMNSFDFELPGRPDQVGPFNVADPRSSPFCANGTGTDPANPCVTGFYFFDPNAFTGQALGTLGTSPRTVCCGPSINNWDFSIQKTTPLSERLRLEFRTEFFNLWNHTQFFNPDGNITNGEEFGTIKRAKDPRQVQFALKLHF